MTTTLLTIVYMGSASAKLKPAPAMTTFLYGVYPYTWFPKVRARHCRNAAAVAITAAVRPPTPSQFTYIVTLLSNYHPRAVTWPPATTRRHQLATTTRHSLGLWVL